MTIVKTLYNLAILTSNYDKKFLSDTLDNVIIGHSLGGTVASIFGAGDPHITTMVFLASYPIKDVSDKRILIITGELDTVLNQEALQSNLHYLPNDYENFEIIGGNHAQFGWYGPQSAKINTKDQQDIVIEKIIQFM